MADIPGLTTDQRNAYEAVLSIFSQYGLESLAPTVLSYVRQGYDAPTTNYLLQQTPEYKARFAGNDLRVKNGLAPLQPAEYLSTEASYKAIMRNSGLPAGFYDDPGSFSQFIGNGVSPTELQSRVSLAGTKVAQADPQFKQAFQDYYGIDSGHLAAYFLDPAKGMDVLNRQVAAADIGGAATRQGLTETSQSRAEQYAGQGVTASQAQAGYGTVAQMLPDEQRIAERFGQQFTQSDAEDEVLGGMASAARKRKLLNDQEQASFSGSGGVGDSFYHPDYGLAQETSGAF